MIALLRLALRNLLRARGRTLLSGGTMALGTRGPGAGQRALADGIARQLTASLVAVQTGHLQVVARPLDFEPQNSPFDAYSQQRLPGAVALARVHRERRAPGGRGARGADALRRAAPPRRATARRSPP